MLRIQCMSSLECDIRTMSFLVLYVSCLFGFCDVLSHRDWASRVIVCLQSGMQLINGLYFSLRVCLLLIKYPVLVTFHWPRDFVLYFTIVKTNPNKTTVWKIWYPFPRALRDGHWHILDFVLSDTKEDGMIVLEIIVKEGVMQDVILMIFARCYFAVLPKPSNLFNN